MNIYFAKLFSNFRSFSENRPKNPFKFLKMLAERYEVFFKLKYFYLKV